jgi:hypothetical protein
MRANLQAWTQPGKLCGTRCGTFWKVQWLPPEPDWSKCHQPSQITADRVFDRWHIWLQYFWVNFCYSAIFDHWDPWNLNLFLCAFVKFFIILIGVIFVGINKLFFKFARRELLDVQCTVYTAFLPINYNIHLGKQLEMIHPHPHLMLSFFYIVNRFSKRTDLWK